MSPTSLASEFIKISDRADRLHWNSNAGKAHQLALWSRYMFWLGEELGRASPAGNERLVFAFALPVLNAASVLVASGLVAQRAEIPIAVGGNEERFTKLKELKPGQGVRVLRNGRLLMGEVSADAEFHTPTSFPVLVAANGNSRSQFLCTSRNCGTVEPTEFASEVPSRQRGLRIIENPRFAAGLLRGTPIERLCLGSRMDFALIGVRSKILAEADTGLLCSTEKGELEEGALADLLRLKEGERDFRGCIISTSTKDAAVPRVQPHVAVFDGANAYLKFRHRFTKYHAVIFLDRSEPHLLEAANEINMEFAHRLGECEPEWTAAVPKGVDWLAFKAMAHE